jgi:photosystem II stability/assembly factor-like uncharacterized protein
MLKYLSFYPLFFALLFSGLFAQKGIELLFPTPTASVFTDISIVDKNTAWAAATLGTVLKTTDAGVTWQMLKSGEDLWYTSIDAIDKDRVYLTSWNNELVSTWDGGKTWKKEMLGNLKNLRMVQFVDAINGFVVGGKELAPDEMDPIIQLWTTKDGGKTWKEINSSLKFDPQNIQFMSPKIGFAVVKSFDEGIADNIFRTADGGKTWEKVKSISDAVVSGLSFPDSKNGFIVGEVPAVPGEKAKWKIVVFKTVDGGVNWVSHDLKLPYLTSEGKEPHSIYFLNDKTGWVLKSNSYESPMRSELFKTEDGGKNWEKVYTGDETGLSRLGFFDRKTGIVLPGLWFLSPKIFRTTNGGTSFEQLSKGLTYNFTLLNFVDSKTGFAADDKGIIKTVDGGNTWQLCKEIKTGAYFEQLVFFNSKEGVAFLRDDSSRCIAYRTEDGGDNWASSELKFTTYLQNVVFADANTVYAISGDLERKIIVKSLDGGKTWKEVLVDSSPGLTFYDILFTDKDHGWINGTMKLAGALASDPPTAFFRKTTDGGLTWAEDIRYGQNYLEKIYFLDYLHGWYMGNIDDTTRAIVRTTDGGNSWMPYPFVSQQDLTEYIGFQDANNGWMIRAYGAPLSPAFVYRTKDGGQTWQLKHTLNYLNKLVFLEKNTIIGGGYLNLVKFKIDD